MIIETGNLVTSNYPIFCHQVNCKGVMGAGIAKVIKDTYPEVYKPYAKRCRSKTNPLGTAMWVYTHDNRICINMFAQDGYGRNGVYTDYEAFKKCLDEMAEKLNSLIYEVPFREKYGNIINFPFKIGCGIAGGDWKTVLSLIQEFEKKIYKHWEVRIVKLPEVSK